MLAIGRFFFCSPLYLHCPRGARSGRPNPCVTQVTGVGELIIRAPLAALSLAPTGYSPLSAPVLSL